MSDARKVCHINLYLKIGMRKKELQSSKAHGHLNLPSIVVNVVGQYETVRIYNTHTFKQIQRNDLEII